MQSKLRPTKVAHIFKRGDIFETKYGTRILMRSELRNKYYAVRLDGKFVYTGNAIKEVMKQYKEAKFLGRLGELYL